MNAGMKVLLIENLKSLKLSTTIRNLQSHLRQTRQEKLDHDEFLLNLTETEVQVRKENGCKRRLKEAKLPLLKPLEVFNFEAAPDLDARLIKELSNCEYVKKTRNIIFMGKSGTGKTHLATGLVMEACKQGIRTRFTTGCGLANELIEARNEKVLGRVIKRYAGYGLLIIDELGYVPFSKFWPRVMKENRLLPSLPSEMFGCTQKTDCIIGNGYFLFKLMRGQNWVAEEGQF